MTKEEMIKFLEPFTDEIEIKVEVGGMLWCVNDWKYGMDHSEGYVKLSIYNPRIMPH